jgi:hypothetical protein
MSTPVSVFSHSKHHQTSLPRCLPTATRVGRWAAMHGTHAPARRTHVIPLRTGTCIYSCFPRVPSSDYLLPGVLSHCRQQKPPNSSPARPVWPNPGWPANRLHQPNSDAPYLLTDDPPDERCANQPDWLPRAAARRHLLVVFSHRLSPRSADPHRSWSEQTGAAGCFFSLAY